MRLANNNRVFWLRANHCPNFSIYYFKQERVLTLTVLNRYFTVSFKNFLQYNFPNLYRLRKLYLPSVVKVNLHDCDSGGNVFASYYTIVLNDKDYCKKIKNDGETSSQYSTFKEYIKWKLYNFKHRKELTQC